MYKDKTVLAIIPARCGSKGIKDKNIIEINQKPLMAYTIEACKKAKIFDEIVVSTDSTDYAEVAGKFGASVPFLRPKQLASDYAQTTDVISHVLNEMNLLGKSFDLFMLLQPTSPLRNEQHIIESIHIMINNHADSVIGICKSFPRHLTVQLSDTGEIKSDFCMENCVRRQNFPQEYRINGAIYLADSNHFLAHHSFYKGRTLPYVMNEMDSIDIDDAFQLKMAEVFLLHKASGIR